MEIQILAGNRGKKKVAEKKKKKTLEPSYHKDSYPLEKMNAHCTDQFSGNNQA